MSLQIRQRNCPICDAHSKEVITKVDFELFKGHPMNGGYDVVQCTTCGFIYANTPVTQNELDRYYTDLSKYEDKTIGTGGGYTQNDKDRLVVTANFLNKHIINKNARVLDLGCANGGLLRELKGHGFTNLVGIDPSLECVNITKEEVGCECYQYSLFDIPESAGKFDVITLTHVLEHVLNVQQTINILDKLLAPSGVIYIECPNATYYKEVIHAPYQEFNAEHINHFTEVSFENLMGNFQYKKILTADKIFKIASDQDYHAVYGLFKKDSTYQHPLQFDNAIRSCIDEYIEQSEKIFSEIRKSIATLPKDRPAALFGVGQFAFKLLKTDIFNSSNDFKLFDNNRMNVGKEIKGVKIAHGSELINEYKIAPFSIIISSLIHEAPIRKNIEELFEKNNLKPPVIVGFSRFLPS